MRTTASDPAQSNQSECRCNAEDLQRVFAQLLSEAATRAQPSRNGTRAVQGALSSALHLFNFVRNTRASFKERRDSF